MHSKDEAQLDRAFGPVEVEKIFFPTKHIKPNELLASCNYAEFNEGTIFLDRRQLYFM